MLGLPGLGAKERLRAVEEHLLDVDEEGEARPVPAHDHVVEERRIPHDRGPAVDAQGVAAARDDEDESDVRIAEDVVEPVGPPVAEPLGDRDGRVVEHHGEAARIALRRHVQRTVLVGCRDECERGGRKPRAIHRVQAGALLVRRARLWGADDRLELLCRGDGDTAFVLVGHDPTVRRPSRAAPLRYGLRLPRSRPTARAPRSGATARACRARARGAPRRPCTRRDRPPRGSRCRWRGAAPPCRRRVP